MRPVCVKCQREMSCARIGVIVFHPYERPEPGPTIEQDGNLTIVHLDRLLAINPYDIDFAVKGDKYRCPECGYEIVTGFGREMLDYDVPQDVLKQIVVNATEAIEITRKPVT